MASYFGLLREANKCSIAKTKIIEWKLSKSGWWVKKNHHDLLPCSCPVHKRSPLDVLRIQLERRSMITQASEAEAMLGRTGDVDDMRKLRSSFAAGSYSNKSQEFDK